MNKRGKSQRFFHYNFFSKNRRGQFFLVITVIIIGMIAGFITLSNFSIKKSDIKFSHVGEELEIESKKVLDYSISQNLNDVDRKALLIDFTSNYSTYSDAHNFYFIFGDTDEITLTGCKKLKDGQISVGDGLGTELESLSLIGGECNPISSVDISTPPAIIVLTVDEIAYPFNLTVGENFYFVVSKEVEGDIYTTSND